MERALVLRRHFFGADSPEVLHACKALAEMCNLLAMSFLQQGQYEQLFNLFIGLPTRAAPNGVSSFVDT